VTIQVTAMTRPLAVLSPSFTVLSFPGTDDGDLAFCTEEPGQTALSQRATDAGAALNTFTALAGAALSPDDSLDLILRLAGHA
jgi:hypothetical protein